MLTPTKTLDCIPTFASDRAYFYNVCASSFRSQANPTTPANINGKKLTSLLPGVKMPSEDERMP